MHPKPILYHSILPLDFITHILSLVPHDRRSCTNNQLIVCTDRESFVSALPDNHCLLDRPTLAVLNGLTNFKMVFCPRLHHLRNYVASLPFRPNVKNATGGVLAVYAPVEPHLHSTYTKTSVELAFEGVSATLALIAEAGYATRRNVVMGIPQTWEQLESHQIELLNVLSQWYVKEGRQFKGVMTTLDKPIEIYCDIKDARKDLRKPRSEGREGEATKLFSEEVLDIGPSKREGDAGRATFAMGKRGDDAQDTAFEAIQSTDLNTRLPESETEPLESIKKMGLETLENERNKGVSGMAHDMQPAASNQNPTRTLEIPDSQGESESESSDSVGL